MVGIYRTVFTEAETEFAFGQQYDLREMRQPLNAVEKDSEGSRKFAEYTAMAGELGVVGAIEALSPLQKGRRGLGAIRRKASEGNLPTEAIARIIQTRGG